ncbi:hypothetical protein [Myroides sp. DF42-4-2]|uniref:type III-A CRISPR-associated protein Cas10/Csm1 n=1 Tax=unclassified Myroides TaxID=2642485 RepID=UPI0025783EC3|nr:hypothetical protein [Myroides sp. DF42-4-2]MDM1406640.1 hypothetical protein [Myroides sp. DF42-4-2]
MRYLVKGDFSGIQEFIFNVKSKGAAKALKARSYYIQLVGFMACQYTVKKLPDAKIYYEGGGVFYIRFKLDNEISIEDFFRTVELEVKTIFSSYGLYLNMAYVPLDITDFGKTWSDLRKEVNIKKLMYSSTNEHFFEPFFRVKQRENKNDSRIEQLLEQLKIKKTIPIYDSLKEIFEIEANTSLFDYIDKFTVYANSLESNIPIWDNYSALKEYQQVRIANALDYTGALKLEAKDVVDFDGFGDFAKHRTGTSKIAVLKLDVDNLGKLFGQTVNEKEGEQYSQQLSDFFNEYFFETLFNKKTFKINDIEEGYNANVYPIFSGGDDCFVIGSWDAVLCFALDFQQVFIDEIAKKIELKNGEGLTISAGIVLVDPTYPVSSFSELAEEALAKAKNNGKNKITIFDLTFTWEEFSHIVTVSKNLAKEMEVNKISRAYLDKIRKSAKGFNALQNTNGADFDRIYKLKYYLSKNAESLGTIVDQLFDPYYETLKANLLNEKTKYSYNVAIYPAIARVTELLTKAKLNYDTRE